MRKNTSNLNLENVHFQQLYKKSGVDYRLARHGLCCVDYALYMMRGTTNGSNNCKTKTRGI